MCVSDSAVAVGELGNLYHHQILASLRGNNGDTKYVPPSGGLFDLVAAPHYLFELIAWWGIGIVAVRPHMNCFTLLLPTQTVAYQHTRRLSNGQTVEFA